MTARTHASSVARCETGRGGSVTRIIFENHNRPAMECMCLWRYERPIPRGAPKHTDTLPGGTWGGDAWCGEGQIAQPLGTVPALRVSQPKNKARRMITES